MAISTYHKESSNKEGHEQDQAAAFSWRLDRLALNPYSHQPQWLQSTLTDLEKRKEAMLEIMQDDGDSFAKRVEMYYKKRPELVAMVGELCKSHHSLAENYDKLRSQLRVSSSPSPNCFVSQQHNEDCQWAEVELEMSKLVEEQAELIKRNNQKKQVIKELHYEINSLMHENKSLKNRDADAKKKKKNKKHKFRNAFCIRF